MITRIIVGIAGTAIGLSMLLKTAWYLSMTGRIAWAEKYLGLEGGTRLFHKLMGLLVILISWIYAFNWMNNLLEFFLGGLFRK